MNMKMQSVSNIADTMVDRNEQSFQCSVMASMLEHESGVYGGGADVSSIIVPRVNSEGTLKHLLPIPSPTKRFILASQPQLPNVFTMPTLQ